MFKWYLATFISAECEFTFLLKISRVYCLKSRDQTGSFQANASSVENYYVVVQASLQLFTAYSEFAFFFLFREESEL